jgi:hypothetical protein
MPVFSCNPAPRPAVEAPQKTETPQKTEQREILARLADEAMIAMASRDNDRLEKLLAPSNNALSGRYAYRRLLGTHADTMILEKWDARSIVADFDPDGMNAVVRVPVIYRASPNRKSSSATLFFHFRKNPKSGPWKLVVPDE